MTAPILLVDDENIFGKSLVDFLEIYNYQVRWYQESRVAISAIEEGLDYWIGIIDRSMPIVSGDEVIRVSKIVNPNIPVICLSAYNVKPSNADYIIQKGTNPKNPDRILEILNRHLPD